MVDSNVHIADIDRPGPSRIFWLILGFISMVLGLIGIPVPGLPTTPFMILAAGSFAKSSQRFYDWIIDNRLFGSHVKNYREGNGIPKRSKPKILATMWAFVLFAVLIAIPDDVLISKVATVFLAIIGTIFILRIPNVEN